MGPKQVSQAKGLGISTPIRAALNRAARSLFGAQISMTQNATIRKWQYLGSTQKKRKGFNARARGGKHFEKCQSDFSNTSRVLRIGNVDV
jgi:hypothetical protein